MGRAPWGAGVGEAVPHTVRLALTHTAVPIFGRPVAAVALAAVAAQHVQADRERAALAEAFLTLIHILAAPSIPTVPGCTLARVPQPRARLAARRLLARMCAIMARVHRWHLSITTR